MQTSIMRLLVVDLQLAVEVNDIILIIESTPLTEYQAGNVI